MAQLRISMPAELERWVDARIAGGVYADAADYLRALIRRDQEEYAEDVRRVRALIQEGFDSGIVDSEPEDVLAKIIAEIPKVHG